MKYSRILEYSELAKSNNRIAGSSERAAGPRFNDQIVEIGTDSLESSTKRSYDKYLDTFQLFRKKLAREQAADEGNTMRGKVTIPKIPLLKVANDRAVRRAERHELLQSEEKRLKLDSILKSHEDRQMKQLKAM